jgi:hypothetical protein
MKAKTKQRSENAENGDSVRKELSSPGRGREVSGPGGGAFFFPFRKAWSGLQYSLSKCVEAPKVDTNSFGKLSFCSASLSVLGKQELTRTPTITEQVL